MLWLSRGVCIFKLLLVVQKHQYRWCDTNTTEHSKNHRNQKCSVHLVLVPGRGPEEVALVKEKDSQQSASKHPQKCRVPRWPSAPGLCGSARDAREVSGSYRDQNNGEYEGHGLTMRMSRDEQRAADARLQY